MLKKLIMFMGLLGGLVLFLGQVLVVVDFGLCIFEGGIYIFSVIINKIVLDMLKNIMGVIFVDFDSWNLGGIYVMFCECFDDIFFINDILFKVVVFLVFVMNIESCFYYQINNNIVIVSDVLILGG